jgi:hypothetical protein
MICQHTPNPSQEGLGVCHYVMWPGSDSEALAEGFVHDHPRGDGDIEGVEAGDHGYAYELFCAFYHVLADAGVLCPHDDAGGYAEVAFVNGDAAVHLCAEHLYAVEAQGVYGLGHGGYAAEEYLLERARGGLDSVLGERGGVGRGEYDAMGAAAEHGAGDGPYIADIGNAVEHDEEGCFALVHHLVYGALEVHIVYEAGPGHHALVHGLGEAVELFHGYLADGYVAFFGELLYGAYLRPGSGTEEEYLFNNCTLLYGFQYGFAADEEGE